MLLRWTKRLVLLLIVVAVFSTLASVASACPNCKEAMEKQDPTHGGIVKGYFYSILFMMSTPYLVLGSFCGMMYFRVRRARANGQLKLPSHMSSAHGNALRPTVSAGPNRVGLLAQKSPQT